MARALGLDGNVAMSAKLEELPEIHKENGGQIYR
jgi:hypothetical protein